MDITQQPQPNGSGATGADAAAALDEIQQRQQQVIKSVLVPAWYWWLMAAAIVAIGAARDSHSAVGLAITIPLAVLVMAGLTAVMIPEVRRRVQVHSATQPGPRAAAAIAGLIVLVIAVTIATSASLSASRVPHPLTIGYAAGAAVIVIGGQLVMGYCRRLMLSRARQQINDATQATGTS